MNKERPSLIKNIAMLSSSLGLGMVFGMLLKLYLPRVLGVEVVGQYYYAFSIASLIFTFYSLGITNYIYRFVPVDSNLSKTHLSSILNFQLIHGLLLIFGVSLYFYFIGGEYQLPIVFLCFYIFFYKIYEGILKPFLISLNRVKFVSGYDVSVKFLQFLVIVVALYFYPNLKMLCIAYALVWMIAVGSILYGSKSELIYKKKSKLKDQRGFNLLQPLYVSGCAFHGLWLY